MAFCPHVLVGGDGEPKRDARKDTVPFKYFFISVVHGIDWEPQRW